MPNPKSEFSKHLSVAEHSLVLVGAIAGAINADQHLHFVYDNKERVVQPHAVGRSTKDGSLLLRAYQVAGESSRPLPTWVLYSIDKIERGSLYLGLPGAFMVAAPGYKMDDSQMSPVLVQVDTSA